MNTIFIEEKNFQIDVADVLEKMGMPRDHRYGQNLREALEKAAQVVKPKAFYMEAKISGREGDTVTLGGQTFQSASLVQYLAGTDTVYPFLCTCGRELNDLTFSSPDVLEMYSLDLLMEVYRNRIFETMKKQLESNLGCEKPLASIVPGSFDWKMAQQRQLFAIFGDAAAKIGVTLSEYNIMDPAKSVSGLCFSSAVPVPRD